MKRILELGIVSLCFIYVKADDYAHSFQHFHGPVSGNDKEVEWIDKHGRQHHDYIAHPHYEFAYGVDDPHTGEYHGQKEQRDGDTVRGEYTVKEPDGNIRTVRYQADKDGFRAKVYNENENENDNGSDDDDD